MMKSLSDYQGRPTPFLGGLRLSGVAPLGLSGVACTTWKYCTMRAGS